LLDWRWRVATQQRSFFELLGYALGLRIKFGAPCLPASGADAASSVAISGITARFGGLAFQRPKLHFQLPYDVVVNQREDLPLMIPVWTLGAALFVLNFRDAGGPLR